MLSVTELNFSERLPASAAVIHHACQEILPEAGAVLILMHLHSGALGTTKMQAA
jgi:ribulose-5-phosphate 4-epimerase/fuculose-1-phosphate aldolase